jgi:hypothetical protein
MRCIVFIGLLRPPVLACLGASRNDKVLEELSLFLRCEVLF